MREIRVCFSFCLLSVSLLKQRSWMCKSNANKETACGSESWTERALGDPFKLHGNLSQGPRFDLRHEAVTALIVQIFFSASHLIIQGEQGCFFPLLCLPVQFSHSHPHILTSGEHASSNKSNVIITFTSLHSNVNGQVISYIEECRRHRADKQPGSLNILR